MNKEVLQNISKIIERDSKTTTYKYALLRGVIDIIQEDSPFISIDADKVHIPTGLLIEKWLLYYYPILESEKYIPQISGSANLAFENTFIHFITSYKPRGGFSVFYNDLKNKGIPLELQADFFVLAKTLRDTITRMPMRYIGRSISSDFYSIFNYETKPLRRGTVSDIEQLINDFGAFTIPLEYYEAFKILGSYIVGRDSILFRWAEFSVNASNQSLSVERVINEVLKNPITERDTTESKKLYKDIILKEGNIRCVWSGKPIGSLTEANIDHVIPFSIWKNNDLWNLLPSTPRLNHQKLDKIPSPEIIERQKELILDYWQTIFEHQRVRFQKEIQVALLGQEPFSIWREKGITQLQQRCTYLIESRGFEAWKI